MDHGLPILAARQKVTAHWLGVTWGALRAVTRDYEALTVDREDSRDLERSRVRKHCLRGLPKEIQHVPVASAT